MIANSSVSAGGLVGEVTGAGAAVVAGVSGAGVSGAGVGVGLPSHESAQKSAYTGSQFAFWHHSLEMWLTIETHTHSPGLVGSVGAGSSVGAAVVSTGSGVGVGLLDPSPRVQLLHHCE